MMTGLHFPELWMPGASVFPLMALAAFVVGVVAACVTG